jgi:hypothetical protein
MTRAIAVAGIVAAALGIVAPIASAQTYWLPLPACEFEDGNPDGRPCLWIDPDTGNGYYVESDNYR